jgi:hypothetical protein
MTVAKRRVCRLLVDCASETTAIGDITVGPVLAESRGSQCSLIADDGKYGQIGEGLPCGASSTGSRRPLPVLLAARGYLAGPDIRVMSRWSTKANNSQSDASRTIRVARGTSSLSSSTLLPANEPSGVISTPVGIVVVDDPTLPARRQEVSNIKHYAFPGKDREL